MGRSFLRSHDDGVRRNLLLDLTSWVGFGITSALLGSMLPAIARREGIDPIGIAILAAIPYAASLMAVTAGRIGPRVPSHLAALRVVGAMALGLVLAGPGLAWAIVAASIYWISHMFGMPIQQRMWGITYPEARRGRLLAIVSTARYAAAGLALLIGGLLAADTDGAAIIAVGGVVGAVCALATTRIATPELGPIEAFSVRRALGSVLDRDRLRQLTFAHALFGGGLAAAVPLITLVQVDRLDLSIERIGVTGMVGVVATLGSMLAWGGVADRKGTVPVLVAAGILGVAGLSLHAIAADHLTVLLASVLVGVSVGAVEVAFSLLIANHVPAHHQAAATAGSNAIFGIRGIIAPVAVVALLQVGVIDLDGALALCVAAALGGALLYLRAATEGRGAAERAVKGQVNLHVGGHQTSRLTDTRSPRRRTGDDPIAQASGTTPFPAVASARR